MNNLEISLLYSVRFCLVISLILIIGCSPKVLPPTLFNEILVKGRPFQVLSVRSSFNDDQPVQPLDYLDSNSEIIIRNGHLIMVHTSGKFLEFKGDTVIPISLLENQLQTKFNLEESRFRPDISMLRKTDFTGYEVQDGIYQNRMLITNFKDPGNLVVAGAGDFCLRWKTFYEHKSDTFIVRTKNAFGEIISEKETLESELLIDFRDAPNGSFFVFDVRLKGDSTFFTPEEVVTIESSSFLFPNSCEINTAIKSLEMAYHMERYYYLVEDALKYYRQAAELSEEVFYEQMLSNYISRRTNR